MFQPIPLRFRPGLFANRSKRASEQRWVDGNHVRFRDDVPAQMGGWRSVPLSGDPVTGRPCGIIGWRPNNQASKYVAIGTHNAAFLFDGGFISDISPAGLSGGIADSAPGVGYSAGAYGASTYGTPRTATGLLLSASSWTFDMFGEVLLGCFTGDGKIRKFLAGADTELEDVVEAPTARAICVSAERHLFAFGCDGNPRLVQWSDREDYTEWTPAATNRAGGYEMQVSSPFKCGLRVGGSILALTETEAVLFSPSFNATVYSRETVSEAAGTVGARSACVASDSGGEIALWWGEDGFYVFDGRARRLPCELHDYVFGDINLNQRAKFEAATNNEFNEVRFSYCSAASNEIDRCVVLCLTNGAWTKAHVARTCWLDRRIFSKPLAMAPDGTMWEHELSPAQTSIPVPSYATSHPITLANGRQFVDISAFWPDMDDASEAAALSIITRDFPGDDDLVHGPFPFQRTTEKVDLYISARQFQVKIAGTGGYWELGDPMIALQMAGEA